ncbi:hypothetical protein [Amycolatopsis sp. NPDC004079]|uniref:hypothetical protein n=1 Tax=Amycolatopsis sp. NPDC004079 TaxID=3154549 RepID=UPI0033B49553
MIRNQANGGVASLTRTELTRSVPAHWHTAPGNSGHPRSTDAARRADPGERGAPVREELSATPADAAAGAGSLPGKGIVALAEMDGRF